MIKIFLLLLTFNVLSMDVEYVKNYDGDTITVNIKDVMPIFGKKLPIRVRGIDTAEIRGKTECEKRNAKQAKIIVKQLLTNAKKVTLKNITRGKYFRLVADVYADDISISKYLLKINLALPYDGGTKKKWRCR